MVKITITLAVNGCKRELDVDAGLSLLELLRDELGLTGAKQGCGVGECGACTVLVDGEPVNSCIYLAAWADRRSVTTIEGIEEKDGSLSAVQRHYVEGGAVQCGFCTPGLVLSTTAMVNSGKQFSDDEIKRELSGHFCRCTGYEKIYGATRECLKECGCHKETEAHGA